MKFELKLFIPNYVPELYPNTNAWQIALKQSQVRLQWDLDYHPSGAKLERRAIQLGLCGQVLAAYAKNWIINIQDISDFVQKQRQNIKSGCKELITPRETVYSVFDTETQNKLRLSASTE